MTLRYGVLQDRIARVFRHIRHWEQVAVDLLRGTFSVTRLANRAHWQTIGIAAESRVSTHRRAINLSNDARMAKLSRERNRVRLRGNYLHDKPELTVDTKSRRRGYLSRLRPSATWSDT